MPAHVVLLSIPGLRRQDLASLPTLTALAASGESASLAPSFPAVTCPVQANMMTGRLPREHGVVANGFYWRDKREVEMWTAWNDCILVPQVWDVLHKRRPGTKCAVWFALHSKGCGADYVCTPAPIHNPDGSESLWCYTKPTNLYGELRDALGHFPLQHFWGPLANITSTAWIADSAVRAAGQFRPDFFYIYLPHLDYAAQKFGPDSHPALAALGELDAVLNKLVSGINSAFAGEVPVWLVASEYTIRPVDHVTYPNRMLRQEELLRVRHEGESELLDLQESFAWALVDHQFSHVFVKDSNPRIIRQVAELFHGQQGIDEVVLREDLARYELDHPRSGDVVLVSSPNSWQAYYWWLADDRAPGFARTVDIHRKPGYDPVEMHLDRRTMSIPLDATLVKGSHGAPVSDEQARGVLLSSRGGLLPGETLADVEVSSIVLRQFGIE